MREIACFLFLVTLCLFVDAIPQQLNYTSWSTVLMIGAHPDDIEGANGGFVSMLTRQNTQVYYLILTNGDKGCANEICTDWTSEHIAYERQQEALNAALVLGIPSSHVKLMDYEDGMVTSYAEESLRREIIQHIRHVKPEVVMSWYPYPNFQLLPSQGEFKTEKTKSAGWLDLGYHPDHQAVGKLVLDSVFGAGVGRLFPGAGPAWSTPQYYMWEFSQPTHYVALDEKALSMKTEAFLAHKTQYPNAEAVVAGLAWVARQTALNFGVEETFAEGFRAYF